MTLEDAILAGESKTLEYKLELPEDSQKWMKSIVAFANGAGGQLVLGVNNKREFIGIPKDVDLFDLKDSIINAISHMGDPQIFFDVTAETIQNAQLLVIQVYPGIATPYFLKKQGKENGTYVRLGSTTRKADWTILEELSNRGRHLFYDEQPFAGLDVTEKDKKFLCDMFTRYSKHKFTKNDLKNLHLLCGNNNSVATNAYAILLGKHDYTSRIQCARFRGTQRVDFLDKKEYAGPLCEQIDAAYNFVLNYLDVSVEINGVARQEKFEIPPAAVRELIVNAAVHRNYQLSSSIQVAIYDDRLEISSPGCLYGMLTLTDAINGRSSIRNRTLARTLEKIGFVEGWGSGLKRIINVCDDSGITPPHFVEFGDMIRVVFPRPVTQKTGDKSAINSKIGDKTGDKSVIKPEIGDKSAINPKTGDKTGDKLTNNDQATIVGYLQEHEKVKSSEMALILGLKISRTRDLLSRLVEENILVAHGANKNRTYSLKK